MIVTFTTSEAADKLNCSVDTIRSLIKSKRLHAVNLSAGKRRAKWVIPQQSIEAFLAPPAAEEKASRRKKSRRAFKRY